MESLSNWSKVLGKFPSLKNPAVLRDPAREQISRPEQIAKLFLHFRDQKKLLTVTVPTYKGSFTSSILQVDTRRRLIFMDELNPHAGHVQAEKERKFRVHTLMKGVELSFPASVKEIREEKDGAIYTVPFPKVIRYHQRRAFFRAQLSVAQKIPVYLESPYGGPLQGTLRDISLGGIGLELDRSLPADFKFKENLTTCTIQLPDDEQIHAGLEIRFISKYGTKKNIRIGGRFVGLTKSEQKLTCHFVADLDRERRRKQNK